MAIDAKTFHTSEVVPVNGTYEVFHVQHLLDKRVALFKSELFPKCGCCDFPVTFLLHREVRALDYVSNLEIRVPLTELQPIAQQDLPLVAVS